MTVAMTVWVIEFVIFSLFCAGIGIYALNERKKKREKAACEFGWWSL